MKILLLFIIGCLTLSLTLISCKQLYNPPVIATASNYLVVEGLINTGTDSTIIKLSRTVSLNSKTTTKTETKAKITVESDANANYPLKEITTGTYASPSLGLSKTAKYRIRIITADSKTYLSDFKAVKESWAIDIVGYYIQPNGLQVYANTHDATNNSRYYRWEYLETWNFHAGYSAPYIASNNNIVVRSAAQEVFFCWASSASSDIVLASSAKLTQDVIFNTVITTVPPGSEKLELGYSILVKQYALTEDAFNFWQNLKKNTEQLGSIFDAQPSQIQGNIHNINNAQEPVFGYISAGTFQQKRLTVLYTKWPAEWQIGGNAAYANCPVYTDLPVIPKPNYIEFYGGGVLPLELVLNKNPPFDTVGYVGGSRYCADCTLRGTNKKPSYWPQ